MYDALRSHIDTTPLVDTHEHLATEDEFVNNGPDVLADLMTYYISHDILTTGVPLEAMDAALDSSNPDVEARWNGIADGWALSQYTGYGAATRLLAKHIYHMDTITLDNIVAAAPINAQLRHPGERLRILREQANLDHVQIDDGNWAVHVDAAGPDFFLNDLSWATMAAGTFNWERIFQDVGILIKDLETLQDAINAMFARYAPYAIAVKTQHAYMRPLTFVRRSDDDAAKVLRRHLLGYAMDAEDRCCLGDWCLEAGVQLAAEYKLPVKIHTGYLAGANRGYTQPDGTRAAHLAPLIAAYPEVDFVLMHAAYPYAGEVLAMAKHFSNVYLDMCWAWGINPLDAVQFVRRALHSVPLHKLFAFGGDTKWPTSALAFSIQARDGLFRALSTEIADGTFDEAAAIRVATRMMHDNQYNVFDITARQQFLRAN